MNINTFGGDLTYIAAKNQTLYGTASTMRWYNFLYCIAAQYSTNKTRKMAG